MQIFTIEPFSGTIENAARDAKEIANAFPHHEFFLCFNNISVTVSGALSVTEIVNLYREALIG